MTPPLSPESRQQLQTLAEALSAEQIAAVKRRKAFTDGVGGEDCPIVEFSPSERDRLCDSHEALRAALAAQEAENERLRQENATLRFSAQASDADIRTVGGRPPMGAGGTD